MKEKKKKNRYLNIQDWMIDDLHLKGNDLLAYALIYGFSQDEESAYSGSYAYVMYWLSVDERSAVRILKRLESMGLIRKWKVRVNGVLVNRWTASTELPEPETVVTEEEPEPLEGVTKCHPRQNVTPDKMSVRGVTKCQSGGDKMSPNNLIEKPNREIYLSGRGPERMDGTTSDWQESLDHFRNRLELDTLAARYDPEMLDEILNNIVEMYNCPLTVQTIGQYPQLTASVRKRLDMLTSQHIEYIMDALSNTKKPVKNIKAYLRTTILNAPITMEHYYQAQGNATVANRPTQPPAPDIPQKVILSQSLRRIGKAGAADG